MCIHCYFGERFWELSYRFLVVFWMIWVFSLIAEDNIYFSTFFHTFLF